MAKHERDINDPKVFDVVLHTKVAHVSVHKIRSANVFHVVFDSGKPDLNITIAIKDDGDKFWTSLPEGRQEEAELAGEAIDAYLHGYRRVNASAAITLKKSAAPGLFD